MDILWATILFTLVGLLSYFTQPLVLAIAMHATGNFFLRSFGTNELVIPGQEYRMIVYGVVLVVLLIVFRKKLN